MSQGASGAAVAAPSGGSPQPSSKDGGGVTGSQVGSQGAGADAFDYRSAFQSQSKKLADTEKSLGGLRQEVEGTRGDMELVKRLKKAFEPEQQSKSEDPVPGWEGELDFYIEQAVEAKNAGRPIPLTANLAISHYRSLIAGHQRESKANQMIEQLSRKVQELSDPGFHIDQKAYSTLDSHIKRGLDQLYGAQGNMSQKRSMFNAIGGQIAGALNELRQKNPAKWDMIRRDPEELSRIANRALRMNIPPKAIQMLEEENLRNTEMSIGELREAFKEAGTIEDPVKRQEVQTSIRRDILSRMHAGSGSLRAVQ